MDFSPGLLKILACPVCKSDVRFRGEKLFCLNDGCSLEFPLINGVPVMLPPKLMEDLKLTRKKWDEEYKKYYNLAEIDLTNEAELEDLYIHVKKYIDIKSRNGLFLEAGCGPSRLSCLLAKEGIKTVGIDLSLNGLTLAKELFKKEGISGFFVCGDVLNMPFKDNIFSFSYSGGVIEHFKNTQKAVDEIYRCLTPGGFTTNTVPYVSLSVPYRILRWGNIPDIPIIKEIVEFVEVQVFKGKFMRFGYEKSFTAKKIRKIFENAGFKNIEIGFFKTNYPLEWVKSNFSRKLITKIANTRLFWPMIYVNGKK